MDHPQMTKLVKALEQIGNGLGYIGKSIDKLSDGNGPNKGSITSLAKSIEIAGINIATALGNLNTNTYEFKQKLNEKSEEQKYEQEIEDLGFEEYFMKILTDEVFFYSRINDCIIFKPFKIEKHTNSSVPMRDIHDNLLYVNLKDCRKATEIETINFKTFYNKNKKREKKENGTRNDQ